MGDSESTKTKLTDWERFRASLIDQAEALHQFRSCNLLQMSRMEYSDAIAQLRPRYEILDLSVFGATIVANSKALHHLFPEFIPPIDRQYTIRFFRESPDKWLDAKGRFRAVQLPAGRDAQFTLFHATCMEIKLLADMVDPVLIREQRNQNGVTAPKALDNAIVNYVRIVSRQMSRAHFAGKL
jgi:hypothetical protein